jgi:prophage regulatory protein
MKDRFLRRQEVELIISRSRSSIYAMVAAGKFPKPARIGGSVRWSLREVESWVEARLAARAPS